MKLVFKGSLQVLHYVCLIQRCEAPQTSAAAQLTALRRQRKQPVKNGADPLANICEDHRDKNVVFPFFVSLSPIYICNYTILPTLIPRTLWRVEFNNTAISFLRQLETVGCNFLFRAQPVACKQRPGIHGRRETAWFQTLINCQKGGSCALIKRSIRWVTCLQHMVARLFLPLV